MEAVRPVKYEEGAREGSVESTGSQGTSSLPDAVLSDITHLLVSEGSPEKVVEAVADALSELVPHDSLMLYRAEPHLRAIRPRPACRSSSTTCTRTIERLTCPELPMPSRSR